MSLLLWLILVGYVLVRQFAGPSADRIAAGMAIFGMVGVPFIYKMVGEDSHPPSGGEGVVMNLGTEYKIAFLLVDDRVPVVVCRAHDRARAEHACRA